MNGIHKRSVSNYQNSILISKLTNSIQINKDKAKIPKPQDRQSLSGEKLKTSSSKIEMTNNQKLPPKTSNVSNYFKYPNNSDYLNSARLVTNRPSQANTLRTNLLGQIKNFAQDEKIRVQKSNSKSKSPVEFSSRLQRSSVTNDMISFSIDKFNSYKNNKNGINMPLNKLKFSPKKNPQQKTKSALSKVVNPMTKSYNTILRDKSPMIGLKMSKNSKESTPKSSNSKLTAITKSPLSLQDKKNNLDLSSNSRTKDSFDKSYSAYSPMSNDSKIKVKKKIKNNILEHSTENIPESNFDKIVESNRINAQSTRSPEIDKNVSKITNFNNSSLLKKYEELRQKNQNLKNNLNKVDTNFKNPKSNTFLKSSEETNKKPLPQENKTDSQVEKNVITNNSNLNNSNNYGLIKVNRPENLRLLSKTNDVVNKLNENKENLKVIHDKESLLLNKRSELKTPEPIIFKIKSHFNISKMGYSGPGVKKVNQDNLFFYTNFNDEKDCIYTAVCDGHGMYGHEVSSYLRDHLPVHLHNELQSKKVNLKTTHALLPKSNTSSPKSHKSVTQTSIKEIIQDAFLSINMKLFNDTKVDTAFSGSTCVSVIYTGNKLICANVGDSRAVLGFKQDLKWSAKNLSRDHKPSEKDEAARIKRRGGRIEAYKGKIIK
jgi:serine/threonine protein phosphatase PrpC